MVKVPIDIAYASGDPTAVQVNVSAATYPSPPPAGVTIGDANTTLSPQYASFSPGPKKGTSGSVGQSVLQTLRTAGVTTSISATTNVAPGSHEAYLSVTNTEFPRLNPAALKIKFDVPPLPVLVKPP